jgi:large subunit ribosomal protein L6
MSRVGKMPIKVPDKVKVILEEKRVRVEGPLGKMDVALDPLLDVKVVDGAVIVSRKDESIAARCRHGLIRNLIRNAVDGVSQGYKKELDITGVGFRAEVKGANLVMTLGYSHSVEFPIPQGIKIAVEKLTHLTVSGFAKNVVGETAACIRKLRRPEPYKGKGIRYSDEVIRRKVGKSAVASGGGK